MRKNASSPLTAKRIYTDGPRAVVAFPVPARSLVLSTR